MRWILRSKIHGATVTEANPNYTGSITIDEALIEKTGLMADEKVLVVSQSGARLETYVIVGKKNSGVICMNGPSAHLIKVNDKIIVMGFELTDTPIQAKKILVDEQNRFVRYLDDAPAGFKSVV